MSQVAGSIAAASPPKGGAFSQAAGAATKAVPESGPPSPESLKGSEADLANIMARLAHLEECNRLGNAALVKEKKDNARLERSLREAIAAARHEEGEWRDQNEEEEWREEAPEVDETAAAPAFAGVPFLEGRRLPCFLPREEAAEEPISAVQASSGTMRSRLLQYSM